MRGGNKRRGKEEYPYEYVSPAVLLPPLKDGYTVLMWVIMRDRLDIAAMLVDRGADMEAKDKVRLKRRSGGYRKKGGFILAIPCHHRHFFLLSFLRLRTLPHQTHLLSLPPRFFS